MGFMEHAPRLNDFGRDHSPVRLAPETSPISRPSAMRGMPANTCGIGEVSERRPVRKPQEFAKGHPRHVPEAWPAVLSRDQLCAYVGVGVETITRICPVRPLDMGTNVVRYSRTQIDEWVATLPPRLMGTHGVREAMPAGLGAPMPDDAAESRTESALDRVRARAGGSRWRKTA